MKIQASFDTAILLQVTGDVRISALLGDDAISRSGTRKARFAGGVTAASLDAAITKVLRKCRATAQEPSERCALSLLTPQSAHDMN